MRAWFLRVKQIIWPISVCFTLGIYLGTGVSLQTAAQGGFGSHCISGKTIVLDAGHGGTDPGAVSPKGVLEKDITLAIAKKLELLLRRAAVYVVMVRDEDCDLGDPGEADLQRRKHQDLARRVAVGEAAEADLYISIHANYFPSPRWSGAQTFYHPAKPADHLLAKSLQTELVLHLGPNRRLAQAADFRVLREASMPAVLVEVGFLSNPAEAKLLSEASYQERVAAALFSGILRYCRETGRF